MSVIEGASCVCNERTVEESESEDDGELHDCVKSGGLQKRPGEPHMPVMDHRA